MPEEFLDLTNVVNEIRRFLYIPAMFVKRGISATSKLDIVPRWKSGPITYVEALHLDTSIL
eukprot:scaffold162_cov486-Pavlova_lutheri.AAC.3